jgi:hypothetical protein
MGQDFSVSNDYRSAEIANLFLRDGLKNDFRADAGGIAHSYTDAGLRFG